MGELRRWRRWGRGRVGSGRKSVKAICFTCKTFWGLSLGDLRVCRAIARTTDYGLRTPSPDPNSGPKQDPDPSGSGWFCFCQWQGLGFLGWVRVGTLKAISLMLPLIVSKWANTQQPFAAGKLFRGGLYLFWSGSLVLLARLADGLPTALLFLSSCYLCSHRSGGKSETGLDVAKRVMWQQGSSIICHLPLSARLRVLSLSVENFIKHFKADPIAGVGSFQFMILLFSQQIKEKTAYHGRVLNGRKGKFRKIFGAGFPNSLHLLLLLLLLLFLFLFLFGTALMLAAKKCKGGMGDVELRGS
uniref:HDC02252 n=1 Tax=Drosophila melanogaster TaxID=7227 RepID=Q6IHL5_DROME|nr:TPA_inf: HDC02252 [Drosophila melanogaster]